jgi:putative salt-induced outer membrane protein YdiY
VRHNTDVLPGTDKTDQVVTANLVYSYWSTKRGR